MNRMLFLTPLAASLLALAWLLPPAEEQALAARGEYLVNAMACADCHTPKVPGPDGPVPDMARHLAGHPEELVMPPAPDLGDGPWVATVSGSMTAWDGPWGTSFTANLTPDDETGLGRWSFDTFAATVKSSRHMGQGRPILPPMPVEILQALTGDDLRAVFAYLQSLPPVSNRVPAPLPPRG